VTDVSLPARPSTAERPDRVTGFRAAVSALRLRTNRRRGEPEYYLFLAGSILTPFGLLLTLIGWYGAAHTPFVFEQIPYLISGGLLGLGFVFAGACGYFAYWIAKLVAQQRADTERVVDALSRLETLLAAAPAAPAAAPRVAAPQPAANGTFYATPSGSMLHTRDCVVVAKRTKLRTVTARTPGFEPCGLCNPLDQPSDLDS
jgi:hypothetical protein